MYMYVLQSLTSNHIQVLKDCHTNQSGLMYDFSDGEIYKSHPVFSSDEHALQIILYFDDVETANPLGSDTNVVSCFVVMYTTETSYGLI